MLKAKIALEAASWRSDRFRSVASRHQVHPNQAWDLEAPSAAWMGLAEPIHSPMTAPERREAVGDHESEVDRLVS